jgi:uncharacterized repeat protein (TIGR01451 family)/MYXO-CTERM domain-containing protein
MRASTQFGLVAALGVLAFAACDSTPPTAAEKTGSVSSAVFTNGDFEVGAANAPPPSWPVTNYLNPGITVQNPQTLAGLNLATTIGGHAAPIALTQIQNAALPMSQPDALIGAGASLRWPRFGNQCVIVNKNGRNQNANSMAQTMTVGAGDVDPADGKIHIRFVGAPVLENPGHPANEQPYFFLQVTNVTQGNAVLFSSFNFSNQAGVPWQTIVNGGKTYVYTDWQLVDVSPAGAALVMGDVVQLQVIASGCSLGGHEGQFYIDGVGSTIPGIFVNGSGPAQANAGTNIPYTLNYRNGGATTANNVVITFNTPPNTTFQSFTAPGLTCTAPAVGAAGLVKCTLLSLPAGGSGSLQITLNINLGTVGTINCGNYGIAATANPILLGNIIVTTVGCALDTDCSAGNWCHESAPIACTPTLANGAAIPTDAPHTAPTLNGTCTAAAGALVCTSTVCDTADNKCGEANGDGPCTVANQAVVCRSGVCDPDGKCGYALNDGPCTVASGGVVCRSGACSVNGLCEPAGGCNVDLDCSAGNWCNESTKTCVPKLANGAGVPTDPAHVAPALNGTCTASAGTLVCVAGVCDTADNKCGLVNSDGPCTAGNAGTVCRSGVCDADAKCGFAVNDGPCTVANAGVVCRSGACSVGGLCEPLGGCNVDADCSGGNWCNETAHTCTAPLANNTVIPTDPPHVAPVLNATCTAQAGTLVCASKVCDTSDQKCGFAVGDGPCSALNALVVCRSGACSTNGTCEPAGGCNVDADCSGGNWCSEATHLCTPKIANGAVIPTDPPHTSPTLNGTCTAPAATLVCVSSVCDTADSKCGYANGDGPCTALNKGTVCRSGACSTNGKCEPAGGCNVDADCAGGEWCNEGTHACTPQVANGGPVPSDPSHVTPTLNGTCTAAAGTLTCLSGVCDVDNACGFRDRDGPCTNVNAGKVCRSGACSSNGTCEPAGGCNVDADCGTGTWCNETAHICNSTFANGSAIPTDAPHTSPTLNGACTTAAGTLVCTSAVCDTSDNACGYKDGDGPCTGVNAAVVCRSGACSTNGLCQPAGGCNVDADCTGGAWCQETTHACTAKLVNGTAMPTDAPHTAPTLNGACSAPAATLVCVSLVCDAADNKCGFANGDGPCTNATGATVCRSGACSPTGLCQGAGGCSVDADCSSGNWCSAGACTPKLPNGTPVPTVGGHAPPLTGTCTSAVGAIVCASGVCDTADNKCGFATGDGTCANTAQCRSGDCISTGPNSGKCEPCATDAKCSGATPTCDQATNTCTTGKCTSDADCASDKWCNAGACVPRGANGTTCDRPTQCVSAVCDPDGKCGKLDGEVCSGADVCRSGQCKDGVCGKGTTPATDGGVANADDLGIQGGGCNCTTAPGNGGSNGLALGGVFFAGALGGWRRRRRASERRSTLMTRLG